MGAREGEEKGEGRLGHDAHDTRVLNKMLESSRSLRVVKSSNDSRVPVLVVRQLRTRRGRPRTGELHFFGYQFEAPHLVYYVADAHGRVTARRTIDVDGASYLQDFALTERHAIFFDTPARMIADSGRTIVLPPKWHRHARTGRVVETPLDDHPVEFPRIDDRRVGRPHRYTHSVELRLVGGKPAGTLLRRHDTVSGTSTSCDLGAGQMPGECAVVGRGAAEDAWLLTFVYDAGGGVSDLVVLDARELAVVARVRLPERVPFGFHGSWVPSRRRCSPLTCGPRPMRRECLRIPTSPGDRRAAPERFAFRRAVCNPTSSTRRSPDVS
ncbi:MAG: carotenoid oxygenase family protein [Polyangia bacterium]